MSLQQFTMGYDKHNVVEQTPGWKKYIIGETKAANSLALPTNKFDKIKIFHWDLFKKIAEEVFWGILPKISMGDKVSRREKVSPGLSAMLTQTGLMMMMMTIIMMMIIMMTMVIMMMAWWWWWWCNDNEMIRKMIMMVMMNLHLQSALNTENEQRTEWMMMMWLWWWITLSSSFRSDDDHHYHHLVKMIIIIIIISFTLSSIFIHSFLCSFSVFNAAFASSLL